MTTEHVLTPDDKCPCGKPQTGSGYCSYECFSKFEMGSPIEPASSLASMGGPLSEADRLAEIRARLDAATPGPWHRRETTVLGPRRPNSLSTGPAALLRTQVPYDGPNGLCGANAELAANAPADLEFLLRLVGVLEGQLAHFIAQHQPCKNLFRTCVTCRDAYGEPVPWPCAEAKRLGLDGGGSDAE